MLTAPEIDFMRKLDGSLQEAQSRQPQTVASDEFREMLADCRKRIQAVRNVLLIRMVAAGHDESVLRRGG